MIGSSMSGRGRRGFTLVELLVVIAIIGVLVALLLPAVQAAREAARRSQCSNNLKQLGIALHNYEDVYKTLPYAWYLSVSPGGTTPPINIGAWGVSVLPYIEQTPLFDRYDPKWPAVNEFGPIGQSNVAVISTRLKAFECPSVASSGERLYNGAISGVPGLPTLTWRAAPSDYCVTTGVLGVYANIAYSGNAGGNRHGALKVLGPFGGTSIGRFADMKDGTTNTFLLGERTGGNEIYSRRQAWNAPASVKQAYIGANGGGWGDALNGEHWLGGTLQSGLPFPPQQGPCGINCTSLRGSGFHSFHPGGCQFLMGDASVQYVSESATQFSVAGRITAQKGEVVSN
ncbi:MAG: DUF1559 domain-containing protein [Pirellulaceae bacterium]